MKSVAIVAFLECLDVIILCCIVLFFQVYVKRTFYKPAICRGCRFIMGSPTLHIGDTFMPLDLVDTLTHQ